MQEHGTAGRYRQGCRCAKCKSAVSAYNREYYIRKGKPPDLTVEQPKSAGPGPVEIATEVQLAGLSGAAAQPALAAASLALARLLDSDRTPSAHPAAALRLADLMDRLAKGSDLRKSGLAAVRALSRPGSAAG